MVSLLKMSSLSCGIIAVDEFLELCRKLDCGELRYMLQSKKKNGDNTPLYQCLGGTSAALVLLDGKNILIFLR